MSFARVGLGSTARDFGAGWLFRARGQMAPRAFLTFKFNLKIILGDIPCPIFPPIESSWA